MTDPVPVIWYCYLLRNSQEKYSNLTYNGSTNNPARRLRQHNSEICGGARFTSRTSGGWSVYCLMSGFPDHVNALQCEWRWKHCSGKPGPREKGYCGIAGRIRGLNEVLGLRNWTSKSIVDNSSMNFKLYIVRSMSKYLDISLLPKNIEVIIVDSESIDISSIGSSIGSIV